MIGKFFVPSRPLYPKTLQTVAKYRPSRRTPFTRQGSAVLAIIVVVALVGCMLRSMASQQQARHTYAPLDSTVDMLYVRVPAVLANSDVDYTGFRVGFNAGKHVPNYVAWELTAERTEGAYSRKGVPFQADADVDGCAVTADYRRSGFDRGHMAPAADMKWDSVAMIQCHYLTNIAPQAQQLNTGAWNRLENLCRKWARRYGRIFIVAGPVLTDSLTRHIGRTGVVVPDRYFKVVVAPDAQPPMGIGFMMPNAYVEGGVQQTAMSIDNVEAITGLDFFSALPDSVEADVEAQTSFHQWNVR